MARGPYRDAERIRRVQRFVAFAEGKGNNAEIGRHIRRGLTLTELQSDHSLDLSMRALCNEPGGIAQWRMAVRDFLHSLAGDRPRADLSLRLTQEMTFVRPEIPRVREKTYTGIRALDRPVTLVTRHRPPYSVLSGSFRDLWLYQLWIDLAKIGDHRLQICPAPTCQKLFLKVGRQEFCSIRCQQRAYYRTAKR